MIQVFYNGILMQSCTVRDWTQEFQYNGPDFLRARNLLTVDGIINPQETSYSGVPAPGPAPNWAVSPTPGVAPMVTTFFAQEMLSQPQKLLFIYQPGADAIFFPDTAQPVTPANLNRTSFAIDCNNGPFPREFTITDVIGAVTFHCRFSIEFFTLRNPSPNPAIVLSNRWTQTDETSWKHYLTTRTTQGRVYCRADLLALNSYVVDDFRDAIMQPIPQNCTRKSVQVTAAPDGTYADYTIVDEEELMQLKSSVVAMGITDVDLTHSAQYNRPNIDDVIGPLADAAFRFGGSLGGALAGATSGGIFTLGASAPGILGAIGFGVGAGIGIGITAYQVLPRALHTIACKVTGNQLSLRKQMEAVGFSACLERLTATGMNQALAATWFEVTHDAGGKEVTVQIRAKAGIDSTAGFVSQSVLSAARPTPGNIGILQQLQGAANRFAQGVSFPPTLMPDIEYGQAHAQPLNRQTGALPGPPSAVFLRYDPPAAPAQVVIGGSVFTISPPGVVTSAPIPPAVSTAPSMGSRGTLLEAIMTQVLTNHYLPPPPALQSYPGAVNRPIQ